MPQGETLSYHRLRVAASRERIWEALLAADLAASPLSKLLLAVRGYGGRALRSRGDTFPERLERLGFTKLREIPGHELVFGLAGQFWRPGGGLRRLPNERAFLAFEKDGCVKAAWNLRIGAVSEQGCEISTETRIEYFGAAARRKFRTYWALVRPFSGLLRRALLSGVKRRAETPTV